MSKLLENTKKKMVLKELGLDLSDIECNITKRWEEGIPHHPKAKQAVQAIALIDNLFQNDSLDISMGGDGDNGEAMMYCLDIYFEALDKKNNPRGNGFNV